MITVLIGRLRRRNVASRNARVIDLIVAHRGLFKTITADNGTEFHGFADVERTTGVPIYFANPYHSWERGTNENTLDGDDLAIELPSVVVRHSIRAN